MGARVLLEAAGLPSYQKFHARVDRPELVAVDFDVTVWQCTRTAEGNASERRIYDVAERCASDEVASTTQQVRFKTASEGDFLLEILDEENAVVDATVIHSKAPDGVYAEITLAPDEFTIERAIPKVAADGVIELPVGAGLFVSPKLSAGVETLAFYDGVAISSAPDTVLLRVADATPQIVLPGAGSARVQSVAAGEATVTLSLGVRARTVPVRVAP